MTPTPTPIPTPPKGTPAWLLRAVSLLLLLMGPALDWIDPTGKLNRPGIQALIIVVFLIAALVVFSIHVVFGAVHEYGWNRKAALDVASNEITEFRTLWPGFKTELAAAEPVLKQLPDAAAIDQKISAAVASIPKPAVVDVQALAGQAKTLVLAELAKAATPGPTT